MFGPQFGFLCLSKLSKVEEFDPTSSMWNLKNMAIATKNDNWVNMPASLKKVCPLTLFYCSIIWIPSRIKSGISLSKQNTKVTIM